MLSPFLQRLLFVNQFTIADGKVELLGDRYIMLNASDLFKLQELDRTKMYSIMKSASLNNIKEIVEHAQVYKSMKDQSLRNIAELSKKIGKSDEGVIMTLQSIFDIYGLGKLHILDLDNKKQCASLKIENSSIALEQVKMGKTKTPACTLTAGILAGMFTYIFNKRVDCVEKKCIGKGDQMCEFEIR
jgi:predicted hydrocarbon binding protein